MLVSAGTTDGLRRADAALIETLNRLGLSVLTVTSDYRVLRRLWRYVYNSLLIIDLLQALALRRAVTKALFHYRPRAIIYATSHSAMLQPRSRLVGAVGIRFDSPAALSRQGVRFLLERYRERRNFRLARVLLPWGIEPSEQMLRHLPSNVPVVPLPVPIEPRVTLAPRAASKGTRKAPLAVAYAGNPWKKGLDVLMEAWRLADIPRLHLVVTGINAKDGRRFLRQLGLAEPARVRWAGRLPPDEHRSLTTRAVLYLAASRFEDFGLAQLEALMDGALLVTVPSAGPYEALNLARELDERLVATDLSAPSLATAIREATALSEPQRQAYRQRARELLPLHSATMLQNRLANEALPALFRRPD